MSRNPYGGDTGSQVRRCSYSVGSLRDLTKPSTSELSVGGCWPRTPESVSSQLPPSTGDHAAPRGQSGRGWITITMSSGSAGRNIWVQ
ncbi:hypothetical protein GCM10017744_017390 [Streptomyces antimycoticus]